MDGAIPCLCGAMPLIEKKTMDEDFGPVEAFKYKCPACKEKELPFLGQWGNCGALQEWNRIAKKRSYHKRTLEYNTHGVCASPPFKAYEWNGRKGRDKIIIEIYLDNSMYYYCYDYHCKNHGHGFNVGIESPCYPAIEIAKKNAVKEIAKSEKSLGRIARELLLPKYKQVNLFETEGAL